MIIKAYSLYDHKSGLYSMPWFFANDITAIRTVRQFASEAGTTVARYPEDFSLHCIGSFDDNVGLLGSAHPVTDLGRVQTILVSE